MLFLIVAVMLLHQFATDQLPNTPIAMLVFHGSAALSDLLLLQVTPMILIGRLCVNSQCLLLASIMGNFAGWLLYMSYAPPSIYNNYMLAITVAQVSRLFIRDRTDADNTWINMVPDRNHICGSEHY